MKDLDYYTNIGKENFDLKGTELRKWVNEQMEKDEQREAEQRKHEAAAKEEERKEAERVRKHEAEQAEKKAEQAEKVRQHELELARLGNIKGEGSETKDSKSGKQAPRAPAFQLTKFNDKLTDLDSFFDLFEKQCVAYHVADGERVNHLYNLLPGKYQETLVYIDDGATYSQVRDKMLRTYNWTTTGYRERFFNLKPATDETMTAFVQRLQACFDKWVSMANINKDFKSLKDLIITHQISETCHPDLVRFLLERDANDTVSIIDKSDSYFQGNSDKQLAKPTNAYSVNAAKYEDSRNTQYQPGTGRGSTAHRGNRGNYGFAGTRGRGSGNWRGNNTQQSGGRGTYRPSDGYGCYHCREKGHRRAECPKWLEMWEKFYKQDPCYVCKKPGHTMIDLHKCDRAKEREPGNAARVPDISDTARDQHVYPGILKKGNNKKSVTVLRDTGSAVHAVHSNLVSDKDYTGRY